MSIASATNKRAEEKNRDMSTVAEARWLAGQEIKRSWLSYPVTALVMLVFVWFYTYVIDGIIIDEGLDFMVDGRTFFLNALLEDFLFLWFCAVLAANWMSREYLQIFSKDSFSKRLDFMRCLPISAASLVLGRLISMCFSLLLNAPALFVTVYLLSNLNGLGWSYLWFAAVWVGYSLIGAGLWLLGEFTISGKTYTWLSIAWAFLLLPVLIALEAAVELRLVTKIAELVQTYGPLPALASILLGAAVLVLLTKTTIRRVERRDLYA